MNLNPREARISKQIQRLKGKLTEIEGDITEITKERNDAIRYKDELQSAINTLEADLKIPLAPKKRRLKQKD